MTVSSGWASGAGGMACTDDAKARAKPTAINLIMAYLPLLARTKTRLTPIILLLRGLGNYYSCWLGITPLPEDGLLPKGLPYKLMLKIHEL